MRTAIMIPSFRGAWRVSRLLESICRFDLPAYERATFYVVEDPSDEDSTERYKRALRLFSKVNYTKLSKWSNMHGAAMAAFDLVPRDKFKWVLYLGDDLLATPGALSNVLYFLEHNELRTVSLVGIPYWNAHDLSPEGYDEHVKQYAPILLTSKEDMYSQDVDWLLKVPPNPHWDGEGVARPYVNVNGAGFACKLETYDKVGGFAEGTWCLDESISVRTWMGSDQGIVCLPGPPFVHYFGGATPCNPPSHTLHTTEAWEEAMGMTKEIAGKISYEKMFEREPLVRMEMEAASYWIHDVNL